MIKRKLYKNIKEQLYKGKVIVIYGARRVGKTTLSKAILAEEESNGKNTVYFNAEDLRILKKFSTTDSAQLRLVVGNVDIAVIDEAQHIQNIGMVLKIMVDTFPEIQIIATGSSSFDLSNKIGEPLVGRARYFQLFPLALTETSDQYIDQLSNIEQMLVFGGYPSVFGKFNEESRDELNDLVSGYLYKDILALDFIRHSNKIASLLQLLAFQIGNEVSYNEIGTKLGIDKSTVERYIDLLEKCFVIFRLGALSRNLRTEVAKNKKIYFYDLGIRNCLIQNLNQLDLRNDIGALWENFCILERMKRNSFVKHHSNNYFWRSYNQQEVDYIEEYDGALHAYEFKYNSKAKIKSPKLFTETYNSQIKVINSDNFHEFFT